MSVDDASATVARLKRAAAEAALAYVRDHSLIGIGHGTTVAAFIEALASSGHVLKAAVAASRVTERLLHEHGIAVVPIDDVAEIPVYVDGCDQADRMLRMLKGGGGAQTREKLTAMRSREFVCIAHDSKFVERLDGAVVVEVTEHALRLACDALRDLGGTPVERRGSVTEDCNRLVDVHGLDVAADPLAFEREIDAIPGVVECGIFAARPADVLLLGTPSGVRVIEA